MCALIFTLSRTISQCREAVLALADTTVVKRVHIDDTAAIVNSPASATAVVAVVQLAEAAHWA